VSEVKILKILNVSGGDASKLQVFKNSLYYLTYNLTNILFGQALLLPRGILLAHECN
jgi:hypothetical protein